MKITTTGRTSPGDFVLWHPLSWKRRLMACAALLVVLVAFRWEALQHLNSRYLGGFERDAGLYSWLIKHNAKHLFSLPWFSTQAFYPYAAALGWSDSFLVPTFVSQVLQWILLFGLDPGEAFITAYNLILLGASLLSGYLTFRLVFGLSGAFIPAIAGGGWFMSLGYLSGHLGHPQLQFAFFFPLACIFFFRFLGTLSPMYAVAIGLTVSVAFATTAYFALFLVLLIAVLALSVILLRPGQLRVRDWMLLAIGGGAGSLPILPLLFPYLAVRETFGGRFLYEPFFFSATTSSFFSASPFSLLYSWTHVLSHSEAQLFPGITLLAGALLALKRATEAPSLKRVWLLTASSLLAVLLLSALTETGVWGRYCSAALLWGALVGACLFLIRFGHLERAHGCNVFSNRDILLTFLLVGLVFLIVAFGPLGNPAAGEVALSPFVLVHSVIPGFDSIRAVGRAGLVVLFVICVLSAMVLVHHRQRRAFNPWILGAMLTLPLLENFPRVYPLEPERLASPVFHQLAHQQPKEAAAIALPFSGGIDEKGVVASWSDFALKQVLYMHWFDVANRSFVNGYSGQRTKLMRDLARETRGFPDARSTAFLSQIAGLRFVVYVSKLDPNFDPETFERRLRELASGLRFVSSDEEGNYLLELTGHVRLRDDFTLMVPSSPEGFVSLEVMTPYQKGAPKISVDISMKHHLDNAPFRNILVTANGVWERFLFPVPPTSDSVRPLYLLFRVNEGSPIYIRQSLFSPG